jgi:hypothetical protein
MMPALPKESMNVSENKNGHGELLKSEKAIEALRAFAKWLDPPS